MDKHILEIKLQFHNYEQDKWAKKLLEADWSHAEAPNKAEYQAICRANYNRAANKAAEIKNELDALEE